MLIDEVGEGIADGPATAIPEIETRQVSIKRTNLKSLKEFVALLNLATTGRKNVLFSRIRDSPHVKKLSADEFEYRHTILSSERFLNGSFLPSRRYHWWMESTWALALRRDSLDLQTRRMLLVASGQIL